MKPTINTITKEKINFLDDNSYILNNLLGNRITDTSTVLDTVTSLIISDKPLNECENVAKLKELVEVNKDSYVPCEKDDSDSYGLLFSITNYVNDSIVDQVLKTIVREKIRVYAASLKRDRIYSENYRRFVIIEGQTEKIKEKTIG